MSSPDPSGLSAELHYQSRGNSPVWRNVFVSPWPTHLCGCCWSIHPKHSFYTSISIYSVAWCWVRLLKADPGSQGEQIPGGPTVSEQNRGARWLRMGRRDSSCRGRTGQGSRWGHLQVRRCRLGLDRGTWKWRRSLGNNTYHLSNRNTRFFTTPSDVILKKTADTLVLLMTFRDTE